MMIAASRNATDQDLADWSHDKFRLQVSRGGKSASRIPGLFGGTRADDEDIH